MNHTQNEVRNDNLRLTTMIKAPVLTLAYELYKEGRIRDAIPLLQDLLDRSPDNWCARLVLAACYVKSGQNYTADCTFQHILSFCDDHDVLSRARVAYPVVSAPRAGYFPSALNEFSDQRPLDYRVVLDNAVDFSGRSG